MTSQRIGLWLIGARGGVASTVLVGLTALAQGKARPIGLATALPLFSGVELPDWSDFVVGGHEIRDVRLVDQAMDLAARSRALDPTLVGALETVERKILYQYTKLHEKAGRALGMRSGILDRHEQLLTDLLYPHHGLQERTLCFLPMLAWQGMNLLDGIENCASPETGQHAVVTLD